ncbi:hypothetical protein D3C84_773990 [compost metagenome]
MFFSDSFAGCIFLSLVAIAIAEIIASPTFTFGNEILIFPPLLLTTKVFFKALSCPTSDQISKSFKTTLSLIATSNNLQPLQSKPPPVPYHGSVKYNSTKYSPSGAGNS